MNNYFIKPKILTLLFLILMLTMTVIPISTASAAGNTSEDSPPTVKTEKINRLTSIWERLQRTYERQGLRLDRADVLIDKLQSRLDLANENGKDTAALQEALDVLSKAVKDANPIHQSAKGIIASHKGFDSDGIVTDRIKALESIQSLGRSIKEVQNLLSNPFKLMRDALSAFRETNQPE